MDVRAGFDGAGRVGGWVPLEVQLVNEGADSKANVQVVVEQPGGRSTYSFVPTTFSLPVVLPRLSNRRFTMEVNLPNATNNRLTARLVRSPGGELITEQDINMTRVPLGDYFCGVLARDPSQYDFLSTLDLPPPIRRARTAPLDTATVPDSAQLLGSFDCLIIDNAASAQLRPEQLEAIQVWVGTGGLLIEVGGATWQSTLGPGECAVAERARRLHGAAHGPAGSVAGEQFPPARRSGRARGSCPGRRAVDGRLEAR